MSSHATSQGNQLDAFNVSVPVIEVNFVSMFSYLDYVLIIYYNIS
jgi:hypothetical protein